MENKLMRYVTGEVEPRRGERHVARRARGIYDEVRERSLMARGAFALGGDIMEQTAELFVRGKTLAAGDPALGAILADEFASTVHQAMRIQQSLFKDWER